MTDDIRHMTYATTICAPAVHPEAGGLGDVVSGLSRELELRGNAVEVILPKYASMRYADSWDLQPSCRDLWVPWYRALPRLADRRPGRVTGYSGRIMLR